MNSYVYKAKDKSGKSYHGDLEASSLREAAAILRQRGLYVTKVGKAPRLLLQCGRGFSYGKKKKIVLFCRQLSVMLNSGLPLLDTIKILQQECRYVPLKKSLISIEASLEAGKTFSDSMKKESDFFPGVMIYMVAAGEASGTLDIVLARLSIYLERSYRAREKLISSLLYPALLVVMTILVIGFIVTFVLPVFVTLFSNLHTTLPLPTRLLLGLGDISRNHAGGLFLSFLVVLLAGKKIYLLPYFHLHVDALLLNLPILGQLFYKSSVMQFSSTMSVLLESGMPIDEAVGVVKNIPENACFVAALDRAQENLERGYSLVQSLSTDKIFDPLFLELLTVGETTGEMDCMLEKITDFYELDVTLLTERLGAMLEPMMMLILGGVVGAIVFSVALPIFEAVTAIP
jgi:Type II secretory pathway, component PulF